MAMDKYGDAGEAEVLRGREAQVVNDHMVRLGKFKLSDFTDKQRDALNDELETARSEEAQSVDKAEEKNNKE